MLETFVFTSWFVYINFDIKFLEEDWELATTTTAPKAAFNVAVKLVKLGEKFVLPSAGSPDFDALANTVTTGFKKTLTKLPEFYKISVDKFSQYVNPLTVPIKNL